MDSLEKERLIKDYLHSYSRMDVDGMLALLAEEVSFENIENGKVTHTLVGKQAFDQQAREALSYFSSRIQVATKWIHEAFYSEVWIDYTAVLAMDFPNGLKKGETLNLKGKSIFEFLDKKIIKITDISTA